MVPQPAGTWTGVNCSDNDPKFPKFSAVIAGQRNRPQDEMRQLQVYQRIKGFLLRQEPVRKSQSRMGIKCASIAITYTLYDTTRPLYFS